MLDRPWVVLLGAAAAAGVYSLLSSRLARPALAPDSWLRTRGTVVGHRGCRTPAHPSGNTLGAFRSALAAGAGAVELDVQLTEDRQLVVIHDDSTAPLLRGPGVRVRRAALKTLRGRKFAAAADAGETVPTLGEVLTLVEAHPTARVVVELKGLGARYGAELADAVLSELAHYNLDNRTLIISFNPFALYQARRTHPTIPTALVTKPDLFRERAPWWLRPAAWVLDAGYSFASTTPWALPELLGATGVSLKHVMFSPEVAERVLGAGLHLNSWTVNSADEVRRLDALGVTALTTDDPTMAVAALEGGA